MCYDFSLIQKLKKLTCKEWHHFEYVSPFLLTKIIYFFVKKVVLQYDTATAYVLCFVLFHGERAQVVKGSPDEAEQLHAVSKAYK